MSLRNHVNIQNRILRCLAIAIGIIVGAACVVVLDRWVPLPSRLQLAVRPATRADDEVRVFGLGDTRERCMAQLTEWLSLELFWPQPIAADRSTADRSLHHSAAETASTIR